MSAESKRSLEEITTPTSAGISDASIVQLDTIRAPQRRSPDHEAAPCAAKLFPNFPGYVVEKVLGEGGMGIVYRARHLRLDRAVAIKTILTGSHTSADSVQRMLNEIEAIARLNHPNIIQILDSGHLDGLPFYVMELVEGSTLAQRIAQTPPNYQQAAEMCRQLAAAIEHSHENGIVHRDLKPSNVLLTQNGTPKITDFGIAKRNTLDNAMTTTGAVLGTPGYLSPEQAEGKRSEITPASDIFALGVILYEMIAGRKPFEGISEMEVLSKIINEDPPSPAWFRPSVPRDLETICLKCLQKKPLRRYQSAQDLADDLERFLNNRVITARRTGRLERSVKWCRRHPAWATLIGMLSITIPTVIIGLTIANRELSAGIARRQRLLDNDRKLARWIVDEHLHQLGALKGATQVEFQLALQFREFLEGTRADSPAEPDLTLYLANAYENVADILGGPKQRHLGRLTEAGDAYLTAIELLRQLQQSDNSKDVDERYARCKIKLAGVVWSTQSIEAATEILEEVEPLVEKAFAEDPSRWIGYLVYLYQNRFDIALTSNQTATAQVYLDKIAQLQFASTSEPIDEITAVQRLIPVRLANNRATLLSKNGDHVGALKLRRDEVSLARQNAAGNAATEPDRERLAQALLNLIDELCFVPQWDEAESVAREARQILQEVSEADSLNVYYREKLATACARLNGVLFQQRKFQDSIEPGQQAIDLLRPITEIDSNNMTTLRDLRTCLSQVGGSYSQLEQLDQGQKYVDEAFAIAKTLNQMPKKSMDDLIALAESYADLGTLEFKRWVATIAVGDLAQIVASPIRAKADEYFRNSIDAYDQVGAQFELSPAQKNNREASAKLKQMLDETAKKLEELINNQVS